MISPRPDSPAGRALVIIGAGVDDLESLARRLDPAPRRLAFPPGHVGGDFWRWHVQGYETYMPERIAVVSRLIGRLRAAGYVAPAKGPPIVAADVPDPLTAEWWRERVRGVADVPEEGDYDPSSGDTAPVPAGVLVRRTPAGVVADPVPEPCAYEVLMAMVARARAGAGSVAEVVGTSGHAWEVYERACDVQVFWRPRRLELSEKGQELVSGWRP